MAYWTKINGVITVYSVGRTQPEKRYILDTVLEHLPRIQDMDVYVIQKNGYSSSSTHDEFNKPSNLSGWDGLFDIQSEYLIVIDGELGDRTFDDVLKQFMKWICRLAKRLGVTDCLVKINDYTKSTVIDHNIAFERMWEDSCFGEIEGAENWCDYLMWKYPKDENGHYIEGKPSVKNRKKS